MANHEVAINVAIPGGSNDRATSNPTPLLRPGPARGGSGLALLSGWKQQAMPKPRCSTSSAVSSQPYLPQLVTSAGILRAVLEPARRYRLWTEDFGRPHDSPRAMADSGRLTSKTCCSTFEPRLHSARQHTLLGKHFPPIRVKT